MIVAGIGPATVSTGPSRLLEEVVMALPASPVNASNQDFLNQPHALL